MNTNDPQNKSSRFAELATELMGAKMATDFVREVWAEASPEVKKTLADALVASVATRLKDDYALRSVVEGLIREIALTHTPVVRAALEAEIAGIMDAVIAGKKRALEAEVSRHFDGIAFESIAQACARRVEKR